MKSASSVTATSYEEQVRDEECYGDILGKDNGLFFRQPNVLNLPCQPWGELSPLQKTAATLFLFQMPGSEDTSESYTIARLSLEIENTMHVWQDHQQCLALRDPQKSALGQQLMMQRAVTVRVSAIYGALKWYKWQTATS